MLVADGHPLTRDGVRVALAAEPNLTICGEADTAEQVRVLTRDRRPDLVILDLELPGGDAFELLSELLSLPEPPRVVALAGNSQGDGQAERTLRLGASACVSKRAAGAELLRAVRSALLGQIVLGDDVIQRLIRQRVGDGRVGPRRNTAQ